MVHIIRYHTQFEVNTTLFVTQTNHLSQVPLNTESAVIRTNKTHQTRTNSLLFTLLSSVQVVLYVCSALSSLPHVRVRNSLGLTRNTRGQHANKSRFPEAQN